MKKCKKFDLCCSIWNMDRFNVIKAIDSIENETIDIFFAKRYDQVLMYFDNYLLFLYIGEGDIKEDLLISINKNFFKLLNYKNEYGDFRIKFSLIDNNYIKINDYTFEYTKKEINEENSLKKYIYNEVQLEQFKWFLEQENRYLMTEYNNEENIETTHQRDFLGDNEVCFIYSALTLKTKEETKIYNEIIELSNLDYKVRQDLKQILNELCDNKKAVYYCSYFYKNNGNEIELYLGNSILKKKYSFSIKDKTIKTINDLTSMVTTSEYNLSKKNTKIRCKITASDLMIKMKKNDIFKIKYGRVTLEINNENLITLIFYNGDKQILELKIKAFIERIFNDKTKHVTFDIQDFCFLLLRYNDEGYANIAFNITCGEEACISKINSSYITNMIY